MPYKNLKFQNKIIAIDGPAGAGKSSVAKFLAKRLGYIYVDTGAMYRAITLKVIKKSSLKDRAKIIRLAKNSRIELKNTSTDDLKVYLDGKDVTKDIRRPEVTRYVSEVSKIPELRKEMLVQQRRIAKDRDCVFEGRDIGTVVFPSAFKKFYLDADFEERVRRRSKELKEKGELNLSKREVEFNLRKRDRIDSGRRCAPLRKAEDAIYLDTTNMTIEEVVNKILREIKVKS